MEKQSMQINRKAAFFTAAGGTLLLFVMVFWHWDFYFDLNDDSLMRDILSGAYTGTPEPANIQMLYPLSAAISFFYRLQGGIEWYGIFLLCCQFGSLLLILFSVLKGKYSFRKRLLWAGGILAGLMALSGSHLVYVQYTVTVAFLCTAAAGLLLAERDAYFSSGSRSLHPTGGILAALCLLWTAFLLRTEMTLLLLPLVMTAVLHIVVMRPEPLKKSFLSGRTIQKLAVFSILLLTGMGIGKIWDTAALSSAEWREFRRYFDARTELYDFYFYDMPSYEENSAFYHSVGMEKPSVTLLENYNFGLDDSLDAEKLERITDQARKIHGEKVTFSGQVRLALRAYAGRILHGEDRGTGRMVLLGYVVLLFMATAEIILSGRRKEKNRMRWKLAGCILWLWFIRSGLWLFILYRGRAPERIVDSLLLIEWVLETGLFMLAAENFRESIPEKKLRPAECVLILLWICWLLPAFLTLRGTGAGIGKEQLRRENINREYLALQTYCAAHPENFYFVDVYSTVAYSDRMFSEQPGAGTFRNYDLMGGWACKSPLFMKKLKQAGYASMLEAVLREENCRVVSHADRPLKWLEDYCLAQGYRVSAVKCDKIDKIWVVYDIDPKTYIQ